MRNLLPISCWAAEDIPANKAETLGYDALTDAELLSIIIGSGTQDCNAIEMSRIILNRCNNNLNALSKADFRDFADIKGVGRKKVARVMACMELARRRNNTEKDVPQDLSHPVRVYNHYVGRLRDLPVEEFWISLLNTNNKLIKDVQISRGGINGTLADIRVMAREAVLANASILVAVHNHPSGNAWPSAQDEILTKEIYKMCQVMHLRFNDHVIVTDGAYYSFREQGKL